MYATGSATTGLHPSGNPSICEAESDSNPTRRQGEHCHRLLGVRRKPFQSKWGKKKEALVRYVVDQDRACSFLNTESVDNVLFFPATC